MSNKNHHHHHRHHHRSAKSFIAKQRSRSINNERKKRRGGGVDDDDEGTEEKEEEEEEEEEDYKKLIKYKSRRRSYLKTERALRRHNLFQSPHHHQSCDTRTVLYCVRIAYSRSGDTCFRVRVCLVKELWINTPHGHTATTRSTRYSLLSQVKSSRIGYATWYYFAPHGYARPTYYYALSHKSIYSFLWGSALFFVKLGNCFFFIAFEK